MTPQSFGGELRRLREQHGLSLNKFAKLVHYDPGYLSKIENGLKPPTATLAEACDTALDTGGTLSALVPERAPSTSSRVPPEGMGWTEGSWSTQRTAIVLNPSSAISDGTGRAVTTETAHELLVVSANYRRAYRSTPAALSIAAHTEHVLSVQRIHRLAEAALETNAAAARRLWAEVLSLSPNARRCSPSH